MRIAFIGQKGIPVIAGGVEKHVDDLSTQLAALGHEVLVYTRWNYSDRKRKYYKGVRLINLPSVPTKHFDAISHTFFAILDLAFRRVDVVHFHSIGPSSLIWLLKIVKPNTPVVATFHTTCYTHKKWGFVARNFLRLSEMLCCFFADKVITISESLAEYARYKYNIDPVYLPNGILMPGEYSDNNIREKWSLSRGSYVLSLGRLIPHKGVHYLIEAYRQLDTDKKLVIVGDGFFTDAYVRELRQMAEGDDRIIFTGNQSGETAQELFANAYVFVQPSESEGLSIALLEAMSHGRPVLVSDIPENKVAVAETGITFVNRSVSDLRNKLESLLANPRVADQLGTAARFAVNQKYNWRMIAHDVANVYETSARIYQRNIWHNLYKKVKGSNLFGRRVF